MPRCFSQDKSHQCVPIRLHISQWIPFAHMTQDTKGFLLNNIGDGYAPGTCLCDILCLWIWHNCIVILYTCSSNMLTYLDILHMNVCATIITWVNYFIGLPEYQCTA